MCGACSWLGSITVHLQTTGATEIGNKLEFDAAVAGRCTQANGIRVSVALHGVYTHNSHSLEERKIGHTGSSGVTLIRRMCFPLTP